MVTKNKNKCSDAGAEAAQRKALALRCREWEATATAHTHAHRTAESSWKVLAAKRAAAPCLRDLASFVSNQGRHGDAEVILVRN